jgi:hypothetical protein
MEGACCARGHPCWQAVMLIVLTIIAGCHARQPDFMTRVQQDCVAGDQWACGLVDAPSRSMPEEHIKTQDNVKDDVDAILRGIDRAKTAPRVGYPDVPQSLANCEPQPQILSCHCNCNHVGDQIAKQNEPLSSPP